MEISRTCLCRLPLEPPSHTPIPPLQIVTEHWAGLPGSHSGFPLPIYFTHDSVSMNPLQCSCLENPHGQRCLVVYSPRGCKESAKHSTVYTRRSSSPSSSRPLRPHLCPQAHPLCLSLFLPCKYVHLFHFPRCHVYALTYDIAFVFLCLTYFIYDNL